MCRIEGVAEDQAWNHQEPDSSGVRVSQWQEQLNPPAWTLESVFAGFGPLCPWLTRRAGTSHPSSLGHVPACLLVREDRTPEERASPTSLWTEATPKEEGSILSRPRCQCPLCTQVLSLLRALQLPAVGVSASNLACPPLLP